MKDKPTFDYDALKQLTSDLGPARIDVDCVGIPQRPVLTIQ